jgi:hypothetical protein
VHFHLFTSINNKKMTCMAYRSQELHPDDIGVIRQFTMANKGAEENAMGFKELTLKKYTLLFVS